VSSILTASALGEAPLRHAYRQAKEQDMKTRKVTVVDLDGGDQIVVNVGDVSVQVANSHGDASEFAIITIVRPTTDGRRLKTTIKDVKGDGQTTVYEEVAEVVIEPWCRN